MALFFQNLSECPLCGKVIFENEEVYLFPHFIANTKDPFYKFTDSAVHKKCLEEDLLGNRAIKFAEEIFLKSQPENRICIISGNRIKILDNHIFTGLLTSYEDEGLYRFNFLTIDKNNLAYWKDRNLFIETASKFIHDGKWSELAPGEYFNKLIDQIRNA